MGTNPRVRVFRLLPTKPLPPLSPATTRRRPRDYVEWNTLRRWGRLPYWEELPAGYLLREAREQAGLTQRALADQLGCSQQAIAQAERWSSNPTVTLLRGWAAACGCQVDLRFVDGGGGGGYRGRGPTTRTANRTAGGDHGAGSGRALLQRRP
ncbi:MAG: helix-turn-helix transcriptional regulator [Gemmatimonadota bacterium]